MHLKQTAQPLETFALVPIVQIKIVQESSHRQRGLIGPQMKAAVEPEADQHHVFAVLVGRHIAMLDKLPHPLHFRVPVIFFQDGGKPFPFQFRKLHVANSLSL